MHGTCKPNINPLNLLVSDKTSKILLNSHYWLHNYIWKVAMHLVAMFLDRSKFLIQGQPRKMYTKYQDSSSFSFWQWSFLSFPILPYMENGHTSDSSFGVVFLTNLNSSNNNYDKHEYQVKSFSMKFLFFMLTLFWGTARTAKISLCKIPLVICISHTMFLLDTFTRCHIKLIWGNTAGIYL